MVLDQINLCILLIMKVHDVWKLFLVGILLQNTIIVFMMRFSSVNHYTVAGGTTHMPAEDSH